MVAMCAISKVQMQMEDWQFQQSLDDATTSKLLQQALEYWSSAVTGYDAMCAISKFFPSKPIIDELKQLVNSSSMKLEVQAWLLLSCDANRTRMYPSASESDSVNLRMSAGEIVLKLLCFRLASCIFLLLWCFLFLPFLFRKAFDFPYCFMHDAWSQQQQLPGVASPKKSSTELSCFACDSRESAVCPTNHFLTSKSRLPIQGELLLHMVEFVIAAQFALPLERHILNS